MVHLPAAALGPVAGRCPQPVPEATGTVGAAWQRRGMTNSQTLAWLDQQDARVADLIRTRGQFIQGVFGGGGQVPPAFAYTVGLHGVGHPELVVLSLDTGTAASLLNALCDRVRAGESLVPGQLLTFEQWAHRVTVEDLPNPGEVLFVANRHYRRPDSNSIQAYQLTYDDMEGRFPWETGYANGPHLQPRPGNWRA